MASQLVRYTNAVKELRANDAARKAHVGVPRPFHTAIQYAITKFLVDNHLCEQGRKLKLTNFFVVPTHEEEYIPIDAFFFNYSIHADWSDVHVEGVLELAGRTQVIFFSLSIPQGVFYFYVGSLIGGFSLELVNFKYRDKREQRPTIICKKFGVDDGEEQDHILLFSHVNFQKCERCDEYKENIKKCQGCWDKLRIRVSYCSKECQKIDYNHLAQHKRVCGCNNTEACEKREAKIESLGMDPASDFK
jgi:hypothetical protein